MQYKLFYTDKNMSAWVGEGTDGRKYEFPDRPNGWLGRRIYLGAPADLKPVDDQIARIVARRSCTQQGPVTLALARTPEEYKVEGELVEAGGVPALVGTAA